MDGWIEGRTGGWVGGLIGRRRHSGAASAFSLSARKVFKAEDLKSP